MLATGRVSISSWDNECLATLTEWVTVGVVIEGAVLGNTGYSQGQWIVLELGIHSDSDTLLSRD